MEILKKENYSFEKYTYPERWASYWCQINEVIKTKPKTILIIGKGDGIVESVLKRCVYEVKTLDIDEKLAPDFIASVEKMSFQDNCFDTILCAEVLEHLPFEKLEQSLLEMKRVLKKHIIISLPYFGPPVKFLIKLPFLRELKLAFKIPFYKKHIFNGEHCWEIGKRGFSVKKIRNVIKKHFKIEKEFTTFDSQYHRFYVLTKK